MTYNPLRNPINHIVLEGDKSPGIAEVVNADSPRRWDKRNGYGLSGATLWYRGLDLSAFSVKIRLYTDEHWAVWHVWKTPLYRVPPRVRPQASDIWHPWLEELGIKQVVILNVKVPVQEDPGVWMYEVELSDYRRIKLALSKPDGSKGGAAATDPVDVYIDQLTNQVQELATP